MNVVTHITNKIKSKYSYKKKIENHPKRDTECVSDCNEINKTILCIYIVFDIILKKSVYFPN